MQQSFVRVFKSNGDYTWSKVQESDGYQYYVANPRFLAVLQNENARNADDTGYSMASDEGLIISQARINYGKISYNTYDDLLVELTVFEFKMAVKTLIDTYNKALGEALSIAADIGEEAYNIYKMSLEGTIEANNEVNIFSYGSKSEQMELAGFSRVAGFMPTQEIILNENDNSYAEFIVVLNETNYKSRLTQICEFDIMRRLGSFGYMEDVVDNKKFYKEQTLFDSTSTAPFFEISSDDFEKETTPTYLLPRGSQRIKFVPNYTGEYSINHTSEGACKYYLYESGQNKTELTSLSDISLKKGVTYYIDVVNQSSDVKIGTLNITLQPMAKAAPLNISADKQGTRAVKYVSDSTEILNLSTSNNNVLIKNVIDVTDDSYSTRDINQQSCGVKLISGHTYIFEFVNTGSSTQTFSVGFGEVEEIPTSISPGKNMSYYSFTASAAGNYIISLKYSESDIGVTLLDEALSSIAYGHGFGEGYSNLDVQLNEGEKIYFGIYDNSTSTETVSVRISNVVSASQWKINGEFITGNSIELAQGESATLELVINDIVSVKSFRIDNADYKFTTSGSTITIDPNCRISNYFEVKAVMQDTVVGGNINGVTNPIFYGYSLFITPVLSNDYAVTTYSDQNGYGLTWDNAHITSLDYKITAGSNVVEINNGNGNIMSQINAWNYTSTDTVTIEVLAIHAVGYSEIRTVDYDVRNGEYGLSVGVKYVNIYFAGGNGSTSSPYEISCARHLDNVRVATYRNYRVINTFRYDGVWAPIGSFSGVFDGNEKLISNITIDCTGGNTYNGFVRSLSGTIKKYGVRGR